MTYKELPADLLEAFKGVTVVVLEWNLIDGSFYHSDSFEHFACSELAPASLLDPEKDEENIYPADHEAIQKLRTEVRSSPSASAAIIRLRTKDGTFHWTRVTARISRDKDGVPERIVAALLDIHDLMHEKSQLAEAHSKLDHIISTISSGICIYSL